MAVNLNPNSNQHNNPKFLKNLVRSVTTMSKEMFEDYMPETVKIYDNNKDFIKNVKTKTNKVTLNDIKESDLYKSGKQLVSNAVSDLKSGNFYNEERINRSMEDAASSMFGIDFSFMDKLDGVSDGVINDTDEITERIDDNTIATTTTNKSAIVTNTNMNAINMSFKSIAKVIMTNQNIAFGGLNRNFANMLAFKNESTIKFYNKTSNQFMQIGNTLDTFLKNTDTLGKIELGGLKESNVFNQLNSLLGSSELLSMGYYINRLKPDSFDKSKLSPIMQGIKSALMFAMPPVLKDTLAETNTIIKNLPVMLNQKFGDMRESNNALSRLIGDTFYKDVNNEKSKYQIKNKAIGFDGVTRRAIVNVIPELISKIVNAMRKGSADDELVYDYSSGGYRTKGDIKKASEMQFQQQIRGTAGFESDIEKYKNKVLEDIAATTGVDKNNKKTRREVDKALYKMLKDKKVPIKGEKYSKNDTINNAIIETFLKMTPLEKVDFVNAVTRLTTPQEWLEKNESYHNVFDPLGYDDIKKKYDRDYNEELYLYFKSKGMDSIAERVREGDPYNRRENRLSKFNPLYYVVEGLRAGNDLMSQVLLSDNTGDDIDPNSFIGKLNTKINYIMSKPLSEHVHDLKEKFKERIGQNPFIEEIRNAGLVTGIKGLFKEASEYIRGEKANKEPGKASKLLGKLKEDFVDPIVGIFKQAVTDPIKKAASHLGDFTKNVFTTVTEPIKNVYTAYKNRYIQLKGTTENTSIERAKNEREMRENENQTSQVIQSNFQANEDKYTELDKSVSRGILDMIKSVRTDLVKPVGAFATSISLVMKDGDSFVKKVNEFKLILDIDKTQFEAVQLTSRELESAERLNERVQQYQDLVNEVDGIINQIENITARAEDGEEFDDDDEDGESAFVDNSQPTMMDKAASFFKRMKTKAADTLEKLEEKFGDPDAKTPILDSFRKLGRKTASTVTNVVGSMMNNIQKSSNSISNIVTNVLKVGENFFSDTLPKLLHSAGEEIKNTAKVALEELKNTGSVVWDEFKDAGSKIWNTAKDIFGTIGDQILDFVGRVRQQEFDVYIEGGTLTGINNTVYYIQPKQSGYQYMQNKFKQEDEDDKEDTEDSDEFAEENRENITTRIKARFKFIGDIIKTVASSAFSAVTGSIKNLASSLISTIGATIISVIGPKIASVIGKYGGKIWNFIKGGATKVKNRTKKGKNNLGKIMGNTGSILTTVNGVLTESTPVYVVGGFLDGVGGGSDDIIDDITDELTDELTDEALDEGLEKVEKEIAEEIGEEMTEKAGKEIIEEMAEEGAEKGLKKLTKWFGATKFGKWFGNTKAGKGLKKLLSKGSDALGFFGKMKNKIFGTGKKAIKGVKNLGSKAIKGVKKLGSKALDGGKSLLKKGDDLLKSATKLIKGKATKISGGLKSLFKSGDDLIEGGAKTLLKSGDDIIIEGGAKVLAKNGDDIVKGGSKILDLFSMFKLGKVGKAAGKFLPILGDIVSIADILKDAWQIFKKGNSVGKRIAGGLSAVLKVGVEALDIYLLDTGIVSIIGGLLVDWLMEKLAGWIDGIFGKKKDDEEKKSEEGSTAKPVNKEKEDKKEDNKTKAEPTKSTDIVTPTPMAASEGKSGTVKPNSDNKTAVTSTVASVSTPEAFLTYNNVKKYRDFKTKEAETEAKFLAKLSEDERDEYLSNRNASVYSSILRTQDGGKMVRTLMNTAVVSASTNVGMNEDDVISLLNTSVTETIKTNSKTGSTASPSSSSSSDDTSGGGGDGSSTGSGGTVDISGESNTEKAVWKFFTGKGFSPQTTAGILGNMYQESGVRPDAIQGGGKGPAAGICQWENYNKKSARWKAMSDYASSKGKNWTDLQSQLEWLDLELQGKDSTTLSLLKKKVGGYENFKKMTNVKEATRVFEESFERAGKPNMERRYSAAQSYYQKFASSNASKDLRKNEEGSSAESTVAINNKDKLAVEEGTLSSIMNENTTGRLSNSMETSLYNLDTISESINVINNSPFETGITIESPLDTAINLLTNINKNVEDSINKETVIEKQETTKVNNGMNPFMDYVDTSNLDLSLRSFSLDIKSILEGI